jgi:hypothetical protein
MVYSLLKRPATNRSGRLLVEVSEGIRGHIAYKGDKYKY